MPNRGDDYGRALLRLTLAKHLSHEFGIDHIQMTYGFVKQNEVCRLCQESDECHTLLLPNG